MLATFSEKRGEDALGFSHLVNLSFDVSLVINQLVVGNSQHLQLLLVFVKVLLSLLDLSLQSLGFFLGPFSGCSGDSSLHVLDLILGLIQELRLSLSLSLKLVDVGLKVSTG